ncbi:MAG: 1,4-dihydroxy-2-naphthoate polyprenyltransferase [Salinivirgaceae bacterium]|nr:1,4-dihydroxy-2-naphthoate polyprenyltransferase [Salinivirgaceae bacterium]
MSNIILKAWIHAARLRTLPLALSGIMLGSFIAYSQYIFNWSICVLAISTTLLLQILSNFANDYGDFTHGTDNENRVGPERAIQSGIITLKQMKIGMYILGILTFISGIALLFVSFNNIFNPLFIVFLLIGLVAIGSAIKYTVGTKNYGYKGFGDIMVFLFFGIASVFGSYFLFAHSFNWLVLLPSSAIGLLSAGVLNINNMRDIENDKSSKKNTLAVRLGVVKSKLYHLTIVIIAVVLLFVYSFIENKLLIGFSLFLPCIPLLIHLVKVFKAPTQKDLDPELKRLSLSTLLISIWFGIGLIL